MQLFMNFLNRVKFQGWIKIDFSALKSFCCFVSISTIKNFVPARLGMSVVLTEAIVLAGISPLSYYLVKKYNFIIHHRKELWFIKPQTVFPYLNWWVLGATRPGPSRVKLKSVRVIGRGFVNEISTSRGSPTFPPSDAN